MKYELKSGLASYEGEPMGEKNFRYPAKRKDLECALKEALIELAELEDWRDKVFKDTILHNATVKRIMI